ncbi:hypothetical protein [Phyllobacterium zundukense]|uniref:Uncharacterized protein n=1 Tax=Phyllobacterium zundukense TaxID=1867719 RepID=A0ACD4CXH5_9HYPH|nr:hypothetical protein [Phyllobacterium zundukense]UXN58280.1 hypothetical protein N8E88_05590 [Phyllobacterium zundukense]
MNDDEKTPEDAKRLRQQIKNGAYRDALRTRYKPVPNDKQFEELLRRLDDAERKK